MFILLYGPDTFRSRRKFKEMRQEFIAKRDPSGLNVAVFDAASADHSVMMTETMAAPFLADKRLIIIENLFANEHSVLDAWLEFLKTRENKNVVILWEGEISGQPHPLLEFLEQQPYSQKFEILKGVQFAAWLSKEAKSLGLEIEPAASQYLMTQTEGDLWQLTSELAKIAALTRVTNKKRITLAEVTASVPQKLDDNVFHFVEAMVNQRGDAALRLLRGLWESGLNEAEVFGAIIWQVKSLLTIKNFFETNQGANYQTAATNLNLHPFVIKKSLALLPRFSFDKLKTIYKSLLDLDIKIKTSQSSSNTLFDLLVAKMTV